MAEVSLCIPVFNSAAYLDELFTCLRALSPQPDEIILLDDASTDDSLVRLREFAAGVVQGLQVHVLANARNAGIAAAYNRLAHEARGEWVQILDADDLPVDVDFYARIRDALTPGIDTVVVALDSNARLLRWGSRLLGSLVPRRPPLWCPLLGSFATRAGVLYRRRRLLDVPFPDPSYPGSDVVHLLELRREGGCIFLRRPRVFYRVHGAAQSSRHRDYTVYRHHLRDFGMVVRLVYGVDLCLRQLVQMWER